MAVTNGLCLAKASNGDDPVGSFSYATTNLGVLNKPVAWSPLHATPLAHATNKPVVIHELQSSEDPASVAYEWQRTKAITAIVFVYPSDSLPDELYSADSESASSVNKLKIPIVVVSHSVGTNILELISDASLYIKIHVESSADSSPIEGEDDASEDVDDEELSLKQPIKVNSHNPGVLARLLPTSNKSSVKRPGFSLGARLLTLFRSDPKVKVIDPCKLLSMSSTPERFQAVFELFDEFEAYCAEGIPSTMESIVSKAANHLRTIMEKRFSDDAPFHMLAAYRMRWTTLYTHSPQSKKIISDYYMKCVGHIGQINDKCIGMCFLPFFKIAKDIDICWGGKENLLERFCQVVRRMLFDIQRSLSFKMEQLSQCFSLCHMLLLLSPDKTYKEGQDIWARMLRSMQPLALPWSENLLRVFIHQLHMAMMWKLPCNHRFDSYLLTLVCNHYELSNFYDLMSFMAGCHPNLAPRNDSVLVMMWKLLSYMTDLLKQQTSIEKFSRSKTVMSFVAEARDLLLFFWQVRESTAARRMKEESIKKSLDSPAAEDLPLATDASATSKVSAVTALPAVSSADRRSANSMSVTDLCAAEMKCFSSWLSMIVNSRFFTGALADPLWTDYAEELLNGMPDELSDMAKTALTSLVCDQITSVSADRLILILERCPWMKEEVGIAFLTSFRPPEDMYFTSPSLLKLFKTFTSLSSQKVKCHFYELIKVVVLSYGFRRQERRAVSDLLVFSGDFPDILSLSVEAACLEDPKEIHSDDSIDGSEQPEHTLTRTRTKCTRPSQLDQMSEFVVKDVIEAYQLVEYLRKTLPSIADLIGPGENAFRTAILKGICQALSPQPTDLILKPNILAGDRRRAMDSAQLFLSSVKTVLIAKCAQSMPKSAGVSSQASRTVGQELLNFSPLARFLWNILWTSVSRLTVESITVVNLPDLHYLSDIFNRFFTKASDSLTEFPSDPANFGLWFRGLRTWAEEVHQKFDGQRVTEETLRLYVDQADAMSTFYKMLDRETMCPSLVLAKAKLKEFGAVRDAVTSMLICRPLGTDDVACVYPIKQLLSGFGVRIDPAIESLIETHIIVTDISRRPRHGTRVRSTGHVLPRDDSRGGQMTYAAAAQAQSQRRGLATAIDSSNEDDSLHTGQASSTKVCFVAGTTLENARTFKASLVNWLEPVLPYIDLLVFFKHRGSALFSAVLEQELKTVIENRAMPEDTRDLSLITGTLLASSQLWSGSTTSSEQSMAEYGLSLKEFSCALHATRDMLQRFVDDTASLNDVVSITQVRSQKVDVEQELNALIEYPPFNSEGHLPGGHDRSTVFGKVRCMLELLQYSGILTTIVSVCQQYQLDRCLNHRTYRRVEDLTKEISDGEFFRKINSGYAVYVRTELDSLLCQAPLNNLRIFATVQNCVEYCKFIREHKFDDGTQGKTKFNEQLKLVTHQLVNEEFSDTVLNHLVGSFTYILPFLDRQRSFPALLELVKSWSDDTLQLAVHQLQTVSKNIGQIKFWFSRAQGETLENVIRELKDILKSGQYCVVFGSPGNDKMATARDRLPLVDKMSDDQISHLLSKPNELSLIYQVGGARAVDDRSLESNPGQLVDSEDEVEQFRTPEHSVTSVMVSHSVADPLFGSGSGEHSLLADVRRAGEQFGVAVDGSGSHEHTQLSAATAQQTRLAVRILNTEDIDELVRRLGVVEAGSSDMHQQTIQNFINRNQIAREEFDVCQKLARLGHPEFYDTPRRSEVQTVGEADGKHDLNSLQHKLTSWSKIINALHEKYPLLVFFSVQQTIAVSRLLYSRDKSENACNHLFHYFGHLYENKPDARRGLITLFSNINPRYIHECLGTTPPSEVVGSFLSRLNEDSVSAYSLLPGRPAVSTLESAMGPDQRCIVHVAEHSTPYELLCILVSIFGGLPFSFQVLHCQSTTTEEQLDLFLIRTTTYPLSTFVLLEVNELPSVLQERLLSVQLELHTQSAGAAMHAAVRAELHCLESGKSMLQDVPWVHTVRHQKREKKFTLEACHMACVLDVSTIKDVHVVYGQAGSGKSHYIRSELKNRSYLTITVNESFTVASAIEKLKNEELLLGSCIYVNVTVVAQTLGSNEDLTAHTTLLSQLNWFLLGLVGFQCVQDNTTGTFYRVPGNMAWTVYIEVPSQLNSDDSASDLEAFLFHVPILQVIGQKRCIEPYERYDIEAEAGFQVVAKYLQAYEDDSLDVLHRDEEFGTSEAVRISSRDDIRFEACQELLRKYTPAHLQERKILQRIFVRYMLRRCLVLENMPAYIYNTGRGEKADGSGTFSDTTYLGATLMEIMLKETQEFCNPNMSSHFESHAHHQLIYEMKSGCHSVQLLSTQPNLISNEDRNRFAEIGIAVPDEMTFNERRTLDSYISCALDIPLENGRLTAFDEENYVLTLDFAVKMLAIHERRMCGVPVIIEGETGVGKTALLHMVSILWNRSLQNFKKSLLRDLAQLLTDRLPENDGGSDSTDNEKLIEFIQRFMSGKEIKDADILDNIILPRPFLQNIDHSKFRDLVVMLKHPLACLINIDDDHLAEATKENCTTQDYVRVLGGLFNTPFQETFFKLNIHAALTATDIKEFLQPKLDRARRYQRLFDKRVVQEKERLRQKSALAVLADCHAPVVTIFLDEINTSSCMGLFKELLVDKTLDGEPIPDNVFLVAACNPHRSSSVAASPLSSRDDWVLGSYQVRALPPSLRCLCWDFSALTGIQEEEYISRRIAKIGQTEIGLRVQDLSILISSSQTLMREYAKVQLKMIGFPDDEARLRASSCVSQRDIQRVFKLAAFFDKSLQKDSKPQLPSRKSLLLALGMVYYLRLDTHYRQMFCDELNARETALCGQNFLEVFNQEMDKYVDSLYIPPGIAKTRALKENLFATIVCSVLRIPLIIVGAPGSSKTLSFNLAVDNLKGAESPGIEFRDTDRFPSLDPHYYQCSRRSTSTEIENIFKRAIARQESHQRNKLDTNCVVFMDEAGLPEDSHESLKALHYFLDSPKVAFVAITNRVLDAAKTNRAISLFRPDPDEGDLHTLAIGCMCKDPKHPPPHLLNAVHLLEKFCKVYWTFMTVEKFNCFFGLRDFIHFIHFIRRHHMIEGEITPLMVMRGLERNFNGTYREDFEEMAEEFLKQMGVTDPLTLVQSRSVVDILKESLEDQPLADMHRTMSSMDGEQSNGQRDVATCDQVRYKLIIDESEDDSMTRLLFHYNILDATQTRCFSCSDFDGDSKLQQINLVSNVKHAALGGDTVVLSESDAINESFYDLFNQRFHCIVDEKYGQRYYANIAIGSHSKPCRVDPSFQCVVHVRAAELESAPLPFLNRFEKYRLSQADLLAVVMKALPASMKEVIELAMAKVKTFVEAIDSRHFASFTPETVTSLFIDLLPLPGHKLYEKHDNAIDDDDEADGGLTGCDFGDKEYHPSPEDMDASLVKCFDMFETAMRVEAGFRFTKLTDGHKLSLFKELLKLGSNLEPEMSTSQLEMDIQMPRRFKASVLEALEHLYTTDPAGKYTGNDECEDVIFSAGAHFITVVITEWIVFRITSRLMQLLRPEVLILKRDLLPVWVLETYLTHQHHFNLKLLLAEKVALLQSCEKQQGNHNKLVIFTRTKPELHRITHTWPASGVSQADVEAPIQDLVFEDLHKVMLAKLDHIHTEEQMTAMLRHFIDSPTLHVIVYLANTANCSRQRINHLRLAIEDEERRCATSLAKTSMKVSNIPKLFVLVLHSTPSGLHGASSYPAHFLHEWDHFYLEQLSSSSDSTAVDILKVMQLACLPKPAASLLDGYTSQVEKVISEQMLAALPVVVSRISFGKCENGRFNRFMKPRRRCSLLASILSSLHPLSAVVCHRIAQYWTREIVIGQLNSVAASLEKHDDPSSLFEKLSDVFTAVVQNVLTLIISKLNSNFNLDVLFPRGAVGHASLSSLSAVSTLACGGQGCSKAVLNLFCAIAKVLPLPSYANIRTMDHMFDLRVAQHLSHPPPEFPFFHRVWNSTAELVLQAVAEEHRTTAASSDATTIAAAASGEGGDDADSLVAIATNQHDLEKRIVAILYDRLQQPTEEPVADKSPLIAFQAIARNPDLWDLYLSDFIHQRLHIDGGSSGSQSTGMNFEHALVSLCLDKLNDVYPVEKRVIHLHVLAHFRLNSLAKIAQALRPLAALHHLPQAQDLSLSSSLPAIQQLETHLVVFPVVSLYSSLLSAMRDGSGVSARMNKLTSWHNAYQSVIHSMPHLLYTPLLDVNRRSMLYVCVAVSAFLNVVHLEAANIACVQQLVQTLQSYCHSSHRQSQPVLRLTDAVFHGMVALSSLISVSQSPSASNDESEAARHTLHATGALYIQLLLQHYFPCLPKEMRMHSLIYSDQDSAWILRAISTVPFMRHHGWEVLSGPEESSVPVTSSLSVDSATAASRAQSLVKSCCAHLLTPAMAEYWTRQLLSASCKGGVEEVLQANIEEVLMSAQSTTAMRFIPHYYDQVYIRRARPELEVNSNLLAVSYFNCRFAERLASLQTVQLPRVASLLQALENPSSLVQDINYQATLQVFLLKLADTISDYALGHLERQGLWHLFTKELIAFVNKCLLEESTGGGPGGGHSFVLLSRLLKKLHSSQRLVQLLTGNFLGPLVQAFKPFLGTFLEELQHPVEIQCHLMAFARPAGLTSALGKIYHPLALRARTIADHARAKHISEEASSVKLLVEFLDDCLSEAVSDEVEPVACQLRQCLWYCVYHCFYAKKRSSAILCKAIRDDMAFLGMTPCQVDLLVCFLDTSQMVQRAEALNPVNANAPRLELRADGRVHRRRVHNEQRVDSLFQLFNPNLPSDSDDVDLRNAVANLIAAVMGTPAGSSHLWAHMFDIKSLTGTYITGNLYANRVSRDGLLYDCGCELTAEGDYGRPDYAAHGGRGALTLPSLYLLLWANFGAFCVALLTQENAFEQLSGPILSDWQSIRHYCVSQLRTTWLLMRSNLGLNDEERSFFIVQAMSRLQEDGPFLFAGQTCPHLEAVNKAETAWHTSIYEPSIAACRDSTVVDEAVWQSHPFLLKLRDFQTATPRRVSTKSFYHDVEQHQHVAASQPASSAVSSVKADVLQHVLLWRRRLYVGGALLPDLVEFYVWLHSTLAYGITFEQASSLTIGQVLKRLPRRLGQNSAGYINGLFERLCSRYNAYVDFCGGVIGHGACAAVHGENALLPLSSNTSLLSLLSDCKEEGQGNDVLFIVIRQLVENQNRFLDILSTLLPSPQSSSTRDYSTATHSLYSRLLTDLHAERHIQAMEVSSQTCLLGYISALELDDAARLNSPLPTEEDSEFLRIICRHFALTSTPAVPYQKELLTQTLTTYILVSRATKIRRSFDVLRIEHDLLLTHVLGKPRIADPSGLRTVFKFKEVVVSGQKACPPAENLSPADIDTLGLRLPSRFRVDLSAEARNTLNMLAHDLDSVQTSEAMMMLVTILGHIQQVVSQEHPLQDVNDEEEGSQQSHGHSSESILNFLTPLLCPEEFAGSAVDEIASQLSAPRLPRRLLEHLFSLPICQALSCVQYFSARLGSGECQYSHVTLRLKAPMPAELLEVLESAFVSAYRDTQLGVQDISTLIETLSLAEPHLIQHHDMCVQEYLISNNFYSPGELPIVLFPSGRVRVEHYVTLRILLTRLKDRMFSQSESSPVAPDHVQGTQVEPWSPLVSNLWEHLPGWHAEDMLPASSNGRPIFHIQGGAVRPVFWEEEESGAEDEDEDGSRTPVAGAQSLDDDWLSGKIDDGDEVGGKILDNTDQEDADSELSDMDSFDEISHDMLDESMSRPLTPSDDSANLHSAAGGESLPVDDILHDDDPEESFTIINPSTSPSMAPESAAARRLLDDDNADEKQPKIPTVVPSPGFAAGATAATAAGSGTASKSQDAPSADGNSTSPSQLPSPSLALPMIASQQAALSLQSSTASFTLSSAMMATLQNADILKMDLEDVSTWLKSMKFEQYVENFKENDVDGALLSQVDDEALLEIGVTSRLHRKRILGNIEKLRLTNFHQ